MASDGGEERLSEASTQPEQKSDSLGLERHEVDSRSLDQQTGRLMINDSRSVYVSHILWASLGDEVCQRVNCLKISINCISVD